MAQRKASKDLQKVEKSQTYLHTQRFLNLTCSLLSKDANSDFKNLPSQIFLINPAGAEVERECKMERWHWGMINHEDCIIAWQLSVNS